jgi:serine/threonine protein kinase
MAVPSTIDEFLELVRKSTVVDEKRLDAYLEKHRTQGNLPAEVGKYAGVLVRDGVLTQFQAEQILLGKWRRFSIGKYKVLERIGSGGMGSVYLCEHKLMRRRVAIKVLPTAKAEEPSALERFQREARVVAALDHPNIVRAYDIDQEDKLHFLVMEYIDGSSLQEIVKRHGPLSIARACHYIRQAAAGLHHAYQVAHIVHRDIKPGNILVDRQGVVKILDMGLARFFHDEEEILTRKYDENVLGTADYLAPEQALDSHDVDIRADLYSLGATFYFCLTGNTPFNEGTVAQKLIWHQTRQPKPVRSLRPEVPEGIAAVIEKLMAKDREQRYQKPAEVVEALALWTQEPIGPPPEKEMPRLSPAASGAVCFGEPSLATPTAPVAGSPSSIARRWAAVNTSTTPPPATPAPGANPSPAKPKPTSSAVLPQKTPHPRGQASARVVRPAAAADPVVAESENISLRNSPPTPLT